MTESGKIIEKIILEQEDDVLRALISEPNLMFSLEDISVQAQLYHGISPYLREEQSIITFDNLASLQIRCDELCRMHPEQLYYDVADMFIVLLNDNMPLETVKNMSMEELLLAVNEISR